MEENAGLKEKFKSSVVVIFAELKLAQAQKVNDGKKNIEELEDFEPRLAAIDSLLATSSQLTLEQLRDNLFRKIVSLQLDDKEEEVSLKGKIEKAYQEAQESSKLDSLRETASSIADSAAGKLSSVKNSLVRAFLPRVLRGPVTEESLIAVEMPAGNFTLGQSNSPGTTKKAVESATPPPKRSSEKKPKSKPASQEIPVFEVSEKEKLEAERIEAERQQKMKEVEARFEKAREQAKLDAQREQELAAAKAQEEQLKKIEEENKRREEAEKAEKAQAERERKAREEVERQRKIREEQRNADRERKEKEIAERRRLQKLAQEAQRRKEELQDEKTEKENRISANSEKIKVIDAALVTKRQDLGSAQNAAGQMRANFQQLVSADVTRKHEKLVPIKFLFKGRLKDIEIAGNEYIKAAEDGPAKVAIVDKLVDRGIYSLKWVRDLFHSSYWKRRDAYRIYLDTRVSAVQVMHKLNESSSTSSIEETLNAFSPTVAAAYKDGVQQILDLNSKKRSEITEEISSLEERRRELSAESEQLRSRVDALKVLLRGDVIASVQENANSLTK